MSTIGNIVWLILGGFIMGVAWWMFGLLAYISIIGIPWGKACFVIGTFSFLPFGKKAVERNELTNLHDIGTGNFGLLGNIIWFIFAGVWLGLGHLFLAFICFVTIIGIPFGLQHIKIATLSLAPIGKSIVSK